jgi:Short repeat of unknown function (DUF308)
MTGLAISPTQNHHVIALASLVKQVETGGRAVTSSSDFRRPTNLGPGVEALRAKWGWIVALGTIYVLLGLIALYSVVMATVASVFVVGIMMLIAGVAEVSTHSKSNHGANSSSGFFSACCTSLPASSRSRTHSSPQRS